MSYPIRVAADVFGQKVNLKLEFLCAPTLPELTVQTERAFNGEMHRQRPRGGYPPFKATKFWLRECVQVEGTEQRGWTEVLRDDELRSGCQLHVFQAHSSSIIEPNCTLPDATRPRYLPPDPPPAPADNRFARPSAPATTQHAGPTEEEMLKRAVELSKKEYEEKEKHRDKPQAAVRKPPSPPADAGTKGLDNDTSLNHCFVNVALQAMMQLEAYRSAVLQAAHECPSAGKPGQCIMCEVRFLMQSNMRTSEAVLSPHLVRTVLEQAGRCQEGTMADASEIFGCLVENISAGVTSRTPDDNAVTQAFIPEVTGNNLVTVADFLKVVRERREDSPEPSLVELLKASLCLPSLPFIPKVMVYSPVWDVRKYHAGKGDIKKDVRDFTMHLDREIDLKKLHGPEGCGGRARLKGMVTYYSGLHYTCHFFIEDRWVEFDDRKVTPRGTWSDVVDWVSLGGYQPTLLFYETEIEVPDMESFIIVDDQDVADMETPD